MLRFGLRNILRSKPRLVVVALLTGIPFFLLLVMQAIGAAVQQHTDILNRNVDNTLQLRARGSMGHVNMVGNDAILPQAAFERAREIQHVAKIEPYLLAMTPTEGHNFAMIVGVNPGDAKRLESHGEAGNPRLIAGRDLTEADRGKRIAVVGQGVAKWAGIKPEKLENATLTLDLTRMHPVIFALERPPVTFKVAGIYASGYVFGDMQLFIPFDTFREVYGVPQGVSWLFVRAASAEHVRGVEAQLRAALGDSADIIAPTSAAEFQTTATRAVLRMTHAGTWLAAALALIVIFFVMLLVVRNRAWEIGTFKALGASNGGIVAAFLTEAVAFCGLGALLGVVLFAVAGTVAAQRVLGLAVAPFLPAQYKDTLISSLSLSADAGVISLGLLAAVCLAAALAGSAYGMWKIVKLSPVEAIRHE